MKLQDINFLNLWKIIIHDQEYSKIKVKAYEPLVHKWKLLLEVHVVAPAYHLSPEEAVGEGWLQTQGQHPM